MKRKIQRFLAKFRYIFVKRFYTITFTNNDKEIFVTRIPAGDYYEIPSSKVKEKRNDLEFLGWFDGKEMYREGDIITPKKDITFEALFHKTNTRKIIYMNRDGSKWRVDVIPVGEEYQVLSPKDLGFGVRFKCWYRERNKGKHKRVKYYGGEIITINDNEVFTAIVKE